MNGTGTEGGGNRSVGESAVCRLLTGEAGAEIWEGERHNARDEAGKCILDDGCAPCVLELVRARGGKEFKVPACVLHLRQSWDGWLGSGSTPYVVHEVQYFQGHLIYSGAGAEGGGEEGGGEEGQERLKRAGGS